MRTPIALHWNRQLGEKSVVPRYGDGSVGAFARGFVPVLLTTVGPQEGATYRHLTDTSHVKSSRREDYPSRYQTR